jgi:L-amino acid N-acyltransferase YncA
MTTLRLATDADAAAVADVYAPYVRDTPITFELTPPTPGEMRERIATTVERWPWLVAETDDAFAGYAYATAHRPRAAYRWSVDVSVYLAPRHRRRGIGRALYGTLLALLRAQRFHNAYAGITLPNQASVSLHESIGFRPVGVYHHVGFKQGAWHDVGWWHLDLAESIGTPEEPLTLDELQSTSAWHAAFERAGEQ